MPSIMDNIIKVLKEHDVEKLHLDFMLTTLEKSRQQLSTTQELYGPLKLTPDVREWHEQRLKLAGSISLQMMGIAQANLQPIREEIKIAQKLVKHYLVNIRRNNKDEVESLIDIFLKTVEKTPGVEDAFTKIGLMPYVDALRNATETHNRLYLQRNSERPRRQRGAQNKAIMRNAQAAMRRLFEQIDLANKIHPELGYEPLIIKLNGVLSRFTNLIKTRDTYNKKRAQKAKEEKDVAVKPEGEKNDALKTEGKADTAPQAVKKRDASTKKSAEVEVGLMTVDKKATGVMAIEKKDT